jgi:hypothetical protein
MYCLLVSATLAAIAGAFAGRLLLHKITLHFMQVLGGGNAGADFPGPGMGLI